MQWNRLQKNSFDNKTRSNLSDKLEKAVIFKMCNTSINLFCVFSCSSSSSKITNTLTLKFPDTHLSFEFKIIS